MQSFRNSLLQHRSCKGSSSWQTSCFTRGSSPQASVPAWSLSCVGSPWAAASFKPPTPLWALLGTAVWKTALPWHPMGCKGKACSTMGLSIGCWTCAPATVLSPVPSSLTLVSLGLFFATFSHSSLSCYYTAYFPFLKYACKEVSPALLLGSALASCGSLLELAGTDSYLTWGSFRALLTEATPAAPRTLPHKPSTNGNRNGVRKCHNRGYHYHLPCRMSRAHYRSFLLHYPLTSQHDAFNWEG